MGSAALALVIANSPLNPLYQAALHSKIGPLSLSHWINDGLMALFFLLVGLEIKREVLDGHLGTWPRRILPGVAAAGGMALPAIVYLSLNSGVASRGWAIPAATDIAFALGVMSLLRGRIPASLRVFLAALAIIDDLGAVIIIALFYTADLSLPYVIAAVALTLVLIAMNRLSVRNVWAFAIVGAVLWAVTLQSGVHATLAGVILALAIPLEATPGRSDANATSPLHRMERGLLLPVNFLVVPIFGFANAGVAVVGLSASAFSAPVTLGVALGLLLGKLVGVVGASLIAIRLGFADMPAHASRLQLFGVALLCGIGFTMSLFITLLAFPNDEVFQAQAKIGIIGGSLVAGLLGYVVLRFAPQPHPVPSPKLGTESR